MKMKQYISAILALLLATVFVRAQSDEPDTKAAWSHATEIFSRIKAPEFPARNFLITDFGAVAGGSNDCTAAIAKAIDACAEAGGGHVVVPAGDFLTGAIHLKSNVDLHLAATNSVLKFSTDPNAYLPVVFTRFEGTELYNYSSLIYALGQKNIAVTGEGTLDGQADQSNWLGWTRGAARSKLMRMSDDNVPVEQRQFGEADHLRPNFITLNRCANILIEGVKIRRSPMWEVHPLLCTNVILRGVDIFSHGANNDGCDPESSCDVLMEKCIFDTGDDCIAIKSGRNNDGRRINVPAQNIIIRDCTMRDGHAGTAIGSEISGSCSNVFVENCEMSSPNLVCALRLKSNAVRGGTLQNIYMRNVNVGVVKDSVLQIDFVYMNETNGVYRPMANNVAMENITVAHTPRVLNVHGFPTAASITDVRIYNSTFKEIQKPNLVINADVKLVNCTLEQAK